MLFVTSRMQTTGGVLYRAQERAIASPLRNVLIQDSSLSVSSNRR
jgi:hypothetical protein